MTVYLSAIVYISCYLALLPPPLVCSYIPRIVCFYLISIIFLDACFFFLMRKSKKRYEFREVEKWEGSGRNRGEKTMIRIYCVKKNLLKKSS